MRGRGPGNNLFSVVPPPPSPYPPSNNNMVDGTPQGLEHMIATGMEGGPDGNETGWTTVYTVDGSGTSTEAEQKTENGVSRQCNSVLTVHPNRSSTIRAK